MQIAIPLFDDLTALDAIGPYEVLSRLPGAQVVFVGAEARPYVSDNGMLRMHADAMLDAVPAPDIVCVPGGVGVRRELDGPVVSWIRAAHASSTWTTSVCTGSLLLGAAGVLAGMLCIEQNDEWLVGRAYLSAGSISLVLAGRDDHPYKQIKEEVPELQAA
jgi:putative intracellular protease/amidase